jgi:2',3'-cyclic-nucleotide 2'-phosphodiesterase
MNAVFIGDIYSRAGRRMLAEGMPEIIKKYSPDFIIANGENLAGGKGINAASAAEVFGCGADIITTGNHVWAKKESLFFIDEDKRVLRPLNYQKSCPGRGYAILSKNDKKLAVVNLSGRVYMEPCNCPFEAFEEILPEIRKETRLVIVDFHGEASSEKQAFAWHFDGRVSAVFGTHTHVQTADERILPFGTGFITDAGMTGPYEGIIGADRQAVIGKFITGMQAYFEPQKGKAQLNGTAVQICEKTGKCLQIERIYHVEN